MDNRITWELFDGTRFQKFCNELLLLEVSKFAKVFSTPGPDGGVDQLYDGNYEKRTGKWRFQDKYHNSGTKSKDVAALKNDIKTDIRDHYNGEDFLVFLTNINLTTSQLNDLLKTGRDALTARKISGCEVFIWHKATIEAFMPAHPVLYHWHWGNGTTTVHHYAEYFKPQLQNAIGLLNFSNRFYGREHELELLNKFLAADGKSSLALVANGGFGKTRLCIEFMQTISEQDDEWIPVVVAHQGYNANEFARLLQESKRLLVLLDNANEVPEILEDIKRQVEATNGKSKLIITTRNTVFNQAIGRLSSHSRDIQKMELKRLSPETTLTMIEAELSHLEKQNLLALRDISKGVPNIMLELMHAVRNGRNPNNIADDNFFVDLVLKIVEEAAQDIETTVGISRKITFELLQAISILSPLKNDRTSIEFLATLINAPSHDIENVLTKLEDIGLVECQGNLSVKPDPYSDVIVVNTCQRVVGFVNRLKGQSGVEKYIENIIKNLAEAELQVVDRNLFTRQMLFDYFDVISQESSQGAKIKRALELAGDIYTANPDMSIIAIEKWIKVLEDTAHPIHSEKESWGNKKYVGIINDIVKGIFNRIFVYTDYKRDNLLELHHLLLQFIIASEDVKAVYSCYSYQYWQFRCTGHRVRKCCELQLFLKDVTEHTLSTCTDEFKIAIALESCKVLLELEFNMPSYFDRITQSIHYGSYKLPNCEHTRLIRRSIIQALIEFYLAKRGTQKQLDKVFSELVGNLFHCTQGSTVRYGFDNDEEQKIVIDFLKNLLSRSPTLIEKTKVKGRTSMTRMQNLKPQFIVDITELRDLSLRVQSPQEELQMLLMNEDYFENRINTGESFLRLIEEYADDQKIQDDFLRLSIENQHFGTPAFAIVNTLVEKKQDFAKSLLETILEKHPDRLSGLSTLIRAVYHDKKYFYGVISSVDHTQPESLGTIVWMLLYGRNNEASYRQVGDIRYFEMALETDNKHAISLLDPYLIYYAYLDKGRIFALYDKLLANASVKDLAGLLHHTFSDKQLSSDFAVELKQLLDKHFFLVPIDESFGGNESLAFIEDNFGFDSLHTFAKKWIEEKSKDNYGYFSLHNIFQNPGVDLAGEVIRFTNVVKKFMLLPSEELNSHVEHKLLELFRPQASFNEELEQVVITLLKECNNEEQKLLALGKAISIYPPMTTALIRSMCLIAASWLSVKGSFVTLTELHAFFGSDFYLNTGDVKSKSGSGAFPQDLQKKSVLEEVLANSTFPDIVNQYLQRCIKRVSEDIQREIEEDNRIKMW